MLVYRHSFMLVEKFISYDKIVFISLTHSSKTNLKVILLRNAVLSISTVHFHV